MGDAGRLAGPCVTLGGGGMVPDGTGVRSGAVVGLAAVVTTGRTVTSGSGAAFVDGGESAGTSGNEGAGLWGGTIFSTGTTAAFAATGLSGRDDGGCGARWIDVSRTG